MGAEILLAKDKVSQFPMAGCLKMELKEEIC